MQIMSERNLNPQTTQVKIGADDGQGILKICAQLLDSSNNIEVSR